MKEINENNFGSEVASGVVLVDFFADWCMPCKMLAPTLVKLEEVAKVVKVDIDTNRKLAADYSIGSIPTVIIFVDGIEKKRLVGLRKESDYKSEIEAAKL